MSCDNHKEFTAAASRTAGGCRGLSNSDLTLAPFIIAHSKCPVQIVSERDLEDWFDGHTEWTKANLGQLIYKAIIEGRWT